MAFLPPPADPHTYTAVESVCSLHQLSCQPPPELQSKAQRRACCLLMPAPDALAPTAASSSGPSSHAARSLPPSHPLPPCADRSLFIWHFTVYHKNKEM
jgi:hypothetical protein